jgi:hypothetical protein
MVGENYGIEALPNVFPAVSSSLFNSAPKQAPSQPAQPLWDPKRALNNKHSRPRKPKEEVVYKALFTSTYRKKTLNTQISNQPMHLQKNAMLSWFRKLK